MAARVEHRSYVYANGACSGAKASVLLLLATVKAGVEELVAFSCHSPQVTSSEQHECRGGYHSGPQCAKQQSQGTDSFVCKALFE